MRELNVAELGSVSGGHEPERRLPTVTVTTRRRTSYQDERAMRGIMGGPDSMAQNNDAILVAGGGGGGDYDPSPDDGVPGLNIQEVGEDGLQVTAEEFGFFDSNEDGKLGDDEMRMTPGQSELIEDTPENREFLGLWVPAPPIVGV